MTRCTFRPNIPLSRGSGCIYPNVCFDCRMSHLVLVNHMVASLSFSAQLSQCPVPQSSQVTSWCCNGHTSSQILSQCAMLWNSDIGHPYNTWAKRQHATIEHGHQGYGPSDTRTGAGGHVCIRWDRFCMHNISTSCTTQGQAFLEIIPPLESLPLPCCP